MTTINILGDTQKQQWLTAIKIYSLRAGFSNTLQKPVAATQRQGFYIFYYAIFLQFHL